MSTRQKRRIMGVLAIILLSILMLFACSKKVTKPPPEYREPLSFEFYRMVLSFPVDSVYAQRMYDTWENELKDDEIIKNHTWMIGDYRVAVYLHYYAAGLIDPPDTSIIDIAFFTTSRADRDTNEIHTTITIFQVDFLDANSVFTNYWDTTAILTKIKTWAYVDSFSPIKNEEQARQIMNDYLDDYIDLYSILTYLKGSLNSTPYIWDEFIGHVAFFRPPSDFGGAIIVSKLTSKLNFLATSTWSFGLRGDRCYP